MARPPSAGAQQDTDGDRVPDSLDNCRTSFNPDQIDRDADGVGDLCDNCPAPIETTTGRVRPLDRFDGTSPLQYGAAYNVTQGNTNGEAENELLRSWILRSWRRAARAVSRRLRSTWSISATTRASSPR